jgi:hypothetical protein
MAPSPQHLAPTTTTITPSVHLLTDDDGINR